MLYRYLLKHYVPIKIERYIFLVRPDRLDRLTPDFLRDQNLVTEPPILETYQGDPASLRLNSDGMSLLDAVFFVPNLKSIPSSWGRSWETLVSTLDFVHPISLEASATQQYLVKADDHQYEVTGSAPQFTIDLLPLALSGNQAGLLTFDFTCDNDHSPTSIRVTWQDSNQSPITSTSAVEFNAHSGKQIVPLDASPRWLMADQIQTLNLGIMDPAACPVFSLSNVELRQRSKVKELFEVNSSI